MAGFSGILDTGQVEDLMIVQFRLKLDKFVALGL